MPFLGMMPTKMNAQVGVISLTGNIVITKSPLTQVKHAIKRMDRLFGNKNLQDHIIYILAGLGLICLGRNLL